MPDPSVKLVVGLGNPGEAYRHHRHNLGFRVVDELARRLGWTFRSGALTYAAAAGDQAGSGVVLLKPLTFMNLSGQAVADWSRDTGLGVTGIPDVPQDLAAPAEAAAGAASAVRPLVVCDDLTLPLGSVRIRPRGSSGGQNGLDSVIDRLGGEEFPRLRLGIAPLQGCVDPADWAAYVLADFDPPERTAAAELVAHAAAAVEFWLEHGLEPTISRFNRRLRPGPEDGD